MTSELHTPIHHDPAPSATALWDVTPHCNFGCTYCYSELLQNRSHETTQHLSIGSITEAFDTYLPEWTVNFTGGEPFVYRRLPEIAAALARNHLLGFYTNLSIAVPVRRFADVVPPSRVRFINAGFHVMERLKTDGDFRGFLELYHLLADRGFPIAASYIIHPDNETRARSDVEFLAGQGVRIHAQVFRGILNGRSYPESFSPEALAVCEMSECEPRRGEPVRSQMSGLGGLCRAGAIFMEINANGDAFRCGTDRGLGRDCLGNLFDGSLRVHPGPTLCRSDVCVSCRQGMSLAVRPMRSLGRATAPA